MPRPAGAARALRAAGAATPGTGVSTTSSSARGDEEGPTLSTESDTQTGPGTTTAPTDPVTLEHAEEGVPAVDDVSHPLTGDAPVAPEAPTFTELGVREEIVRSLAEVGIHRTFAIQALTLPLALAGDDLIGQARTGMGKTLGFGVPLLHRITTSGSGTTTLDGTPRALVVVPTRELCLQVTQDLVDASKHLDMTVHAIYGGRPYESQIAALQKGVDVVVGTPGRLLDLAQQGHLVLGKIGVLVLDEADEMLDLGFLPDIERILRMVPDARQTMLFSATMPGPIITLARTFLTQPTHIRAEEPDSSAVHDRTTQHVYRAHAMDKVEVVARILQARERGLTMIFTRTKRTAQKVADDLAERGFSVGAVHGDLGQGAREQALKAFRSGTIDVLVATDVAARGIDVTDVTHVINYQCTDDEKTYVHRIGRTGRAGKTGVAVTLVDWDDMPKWQLIDKALNLEMAEPVETYSTSPHLFTELDIPEGVTGRAPGAPPASTAPRTTERDGDRGRDSGRGGRGSSGRSGGGRSGGGREPGRDRAPAPRQEAATTATAEHGQAPEVGEDGATRTRTRRRRTRSGGEGNEGVATTGAPASAPTAGPADGAAPAGEGSGPRRRRRRGGRSGGGAGQPAAAPGTD